MTDTKLTCALLYPITGGPDINCKRAMLHIFPTELYKNSYSPTAHLIGIVLRVDIRDSDPSGPLIHMRKIFNDKAEPDSTLSTVSLSSQSQARRCQ